MPHGAMHLWFIFVIVGLYIVLPFIKRMTDTMTKSEAEYFIVLSMILTFLPKTLSSFPAFDFFTSYITKFEINFAAGYVGLFVAGWYIDKFDHTRTFKNWAYLIGFAGFLYMFITTVYFSRERGFVADEFMSFKSLSAFLMAFGMMMFFKDRFAKKQFKRKTLSNGLSNSNLFGNKEQIQQMLTTLNIDLKIRGEKLTLEDYAQISDFLTI